jgi:hypothetical protein
MSLRSVTDQRARLLRAAVGFALALITFVAAPATPAGRWNRAGPDDSELLVTLHYAREGK